MRAFQFVKIPGCFLGVVIFGLMAFFVYESTDGRRVQYALEWTRLPPLPRSAKILGTTLDYSLNSDYICATFKAPMGDIEKWLSQVHHLKREAWSTVGSSGRHIQNYTVPRDENAHWGYVEVEESTGVVTLRAGYN